MVEPPSIAELRDASGISQPYASMIRANYRDPPRSLAIVFYRKLGWRHPVLDSLSDEQIEVLEQVEPWTPPKERAA